MIMSILFLDSTHATPSNDTQPLETAAIICPMCSRNNLIQDFERFEGYYYSRTPDERREEFPNSKRHTGHYCCEADWCDYELRYKSADVKENFHYVGGRTAFCFFRPPNSNIVYVCYHGH